MWESQKAVISLPIHNRSDHDIEITRFEKSCNCASVSPPTLVVPANSSATVTVEMDLPDRTGREVGDTRRPFAVDVHPIWAASGRKEVWHVHGTVVSRATLNQVAIHFADTNRHGQPARPRTATLTTHVPCRDVVCRTDNNAVAVSIKDTEPGKYKLTFVPDTSRPAGAFSTKVRVFGKSSADSDAVEVLAFDVTGEL